ncbi:hypothetical protein BH20ACT10_BH20ACT10_12560 [soil metagenome]
MAGDLLAEFADAATDFIERNGLRSACAGCAQRLCNPL